MKTMETSHIYFEPLKNPYTATTEHTPYNIHLESPRHCPECFNTQIHIDTHRSETVCKKCGLVLTGPSSYTIKGKTQYSYYNQYHLKLKIEKGECKNTCLTVEQTTK